MTQDQSHSDPTPGRLSVMEPLRDSDGDWRYYTPSRHSSGSISEAEAVANGIRMSLCWNACTDLSAEQVAAIPALITHYQEMGS